MAPTPVFEADLDTLKAKLRLSQMGEESDGYALLTEALRQVRVGFIRELTKARVDYIAAIALTEDPSDDDGVLRLTAASTEVLWVRYELMSTMPTLFLDRGAQDSIQVWNEEGAFRSSTAIGLEKQRNSLWTTIVSNLDLLRGSVGIGSELSIRVDTLEPDDDDVSRPGQSAGILI